MLSDSGIPYVISVNSDQSAMDECAILFQDRFYQHIFEGKPVQKAFDNAKVAKSIANQEIQVCCCAHEHHADCLWQKKYQEDPIAAHALHSNGGGVCKCKESGYKDQEHSKTCTDLTNFKSNMEELEPQEEENGNSDDGFDNLNFDDDDDEFGDLNFDDDDNDEEKTKYNFD